jgi:hypothetical protein
VAIWTRLHPEKYCIIAWWLILSALCGLSAMKHINCLLMALTRPHWNCYSLGPNVFCIFATTEILILIDILCEVGKSLETSNNVILLISIWHGPPLDQVIKGLDLWSQVSHHSLHRHYSGIHFIVTTFCYSMCSQLPLLNHRVSGCHPETLKAASWQFNCWYA